MDSNKINLITQNFFYNSKILNADSINKGLINKTYIIEQISNGKKSKFILQCLSNIFECKEIINMNHRLITDHIKEKIRNSFFNSYYQRWEVPSLIKCNSNDLYIFPYDSNFWRAMVYIESAFSLDVLENKIMAYETGIGLAKFHSICSDFDLSKLKVGLKNFHDTNYFIEQFNLTIKEFNFKKLNFKVNERVQNLILNLSNNISHAKIILEYLKEKSIDLSIIHGDPKLNNFLFDIQHRYVVSLIDLDTVSSGYLLTDLADCIRSICNMAGEDPININNVYFDINSLKYFLDGYFSILNRHGNYCFELLPEFIYLIIVELSIRFLNDFLNSNSYFKTKYQTQNLYRAEVQYRLLCSFVSQIPALLNLLHKIGISSNPIFFSDVRKIV